MDTSISKRGRKDEEETLDGMGVDSMYDANSDTN